jgi:serine/threonine protein kinase
MKRQQQLRTIMPPVAAAAGAAAPSRTRRVGPGLVPTQPFPSPARPPSILGKGSYGAVYVIEHLPELIRIEMARHQHEPDARFVIKLVRVPVARSRTVDEVEVSDVAALVHAYRNRVVLKAGLPKYNSHLMKRHDYAEQELQSNIALVHGVSDAVSDAKSVDAWVDTLTKYTPFLFQTGTAGLGQAEAVVLAGLRLYRVVESSSSPPRHELVRSFILFRRMQGTLLDFKRLQMPTVQHIINLMLTVLVVLERMHTMPAYHTDVKDENILFDTKCPEGMVSANSSIKVDPKRCRIEFALTDYGLVVLNPSRIHYRGTPGYISPLLYPLELAPSEDALEFKRNYFDQIEEFLPAQAVLDSYSKARHALYMSRPSANQGVASAVAIHRRALEKNDLYAVGVIAGMYRVLDLDRRDPAKLEPDSDREGARALQTLAKRLMLGSTPTVAMPDVVPLETVKDAITAVQAIKATLAKHRSNKGRRTGSTVPKPT